MCPTTAAMRLGHDEEREARSRQMAMLPRKVPWIASTLLTTCSWLWAPYAIAVAGGLRQDGQPNADLEIERVGVPEGAISSFFCGQASFIEPTSGASAFTVIGSGASVGRSRCAFSHLTGFTHSTLRLPTGASTARRAARTPSERPPSGSSILAALASDWAPGRAWRGELVQCEAQRN